MSDQKSARFSMQAGMQLLELPDAEARRMTKDQSGPQKSGWFCLTLFSQATGRFCDQDWLVALDKDPTELLANLHAQSGVRRLGGSDSKGMPAWHRKMSQGNKEVKSKESNLLSWLPSLLHCFQVKFFSLEVSTQQPWRSFGLKMAPCGKHSVPSVQFNSVQEDAPGSWHNSQRDVFETFWVCKK